MALETTMLPEITKTRWRRGQLVAKDVLVGRKRAVEQSVAVHICLGQRAQARLVRVRRGNLPVAELFAQGFGQAIFRNSGCGFAEHGGLAMLGNLRGRRSQA